MKAEPKWIDKRALLLLHEESLAAFGGARGIRDAGLLDSALSRPVNLQLYAPASDLATLAGACGYGIAKNHAFIDGNKRAAFLSIGLFLSINSARLRVDQVEAINTILALASGTVDEGALANWIRENSVAE